MDGIDSFDNPVVFQGGMFGGRNVPLLITFKPELSETPVKQGGFAPLLRDWKGGGLPWGGREASSWGLEDSVRPCTTRLSVAGFFVTLGRFPGIREVILRVRKAFFLGEDPTLFDNPNRSVISGEHRPCSEHCTQRSTVGRLCTPVYTPWVW